MFELLLQADRALAAGSLDQAERTYWQLIELDPSNAIALAGLARVSLGRGDERLARTFAYRALAIDPENLSARRVVEGLDHAGTEPMETEVPDLTLAAAERLETLGRRRSNRPGEPVADAAEAAADRDGVTRGSAPEKTPRPGSQPDLVSDLPSEPLKDRRQAGRLAASAAAAAAAMLSPTHQSKGRHEPHHAMPSGKRRFDTTDLRTAPQDPYAAAESAAAVEAVDAADVVERTPEAVSGQHHGRVEVAVAGRADESAPTVAMRIAKAAEKAQLDAAALEVAQTIEAGAEAAEAEESVAIRISLITEAAGLEAAELEAARLEAAELDAVEEKPDRARAEEAGSLVSPRPAPGSRASASMVSVGQTEQDAEAEALREAVAIVLGGEAEAAHVKSGDEPSKATEPVGSPAGPDAPARPAAGSSETAEQPQPGTPAGPPAPQPESPTPGRKRGLLRRFRRG